MGFQNPWIQAGMRIYDVKNEYEKSMGIYRSNNMVVNVVVDFEDYNPTERREASAASELRFL